jgi:hypothetical protein
MPTTKPIGPLTGSPSARQMLEEAVDLIDVPPGAGPPAVFLVAPLVLFALMLAGPFLALLTIVVFLVAMTSLVALAGVVLASPYLLVRELRRHRPALRGRVGAPRARLVHARARRAAA